MTKVNITRLDSVTSNDAAATAAINNNFRAIQDAVENTLSRDGTTPNFMDSDLDLNAHRIINVKDPEASTDVITKGWFDQFVEDATSAAEGAVASALAAASSAQASSVSAMEAAARAALAADEAAISKDWATKMDGPVDGVDYSSKYYASQITPIATDITTVAGISSDVTNVASNSADISTVAGISTDIQNVADAAEQIETIADFAADITAVAAVATDVAAVADDLTNIDNVADNKTNIDTVAGNSSNISTVAGISSDVTTVASNTSNIASVVSNASNINAVAGDITNINAVAADLTNIDNASTYAAEAKQWAVGEPTEPSGGSAKYWAGQAAAGQVQADWTEADSTSKAYIKNKPSLATVATSGSYTDLSNTPTIDQSYNALSTNAQSGTAVAEALSSFETLPSQTGHSGEYLTTDGTDASWDNVKAVENAQDENTLGIWQGSQQEWEHAEITDWRKWQTDVIGTAASSASTNWVEYRQAYGSCYQNGAYYMTFQGSTSGNGLYKSTDKKNWTNVKSVSSLKYILHAKGKYIIYWNAKLYSAPEDTPLESSTWQENATVSEVSPNATTGKNLFECGNKVFLTYSGTKYYYSEDGVTWNTSTLPKTLPSFTPKFAYFNNKYIAIGWSAYKGYYLESSDGITWTDNSIKIGDIIGDSSIIAVYDMISNGSTFVCAAIGSQNTNKGIYSTTDFVNWTSSDPLGAITEVLYYNDGIFIANPRSTSSGLAYSADGVTWYTTPSQTKAYAQVVYVGNDTYVGFATGNTRARAVLDLSFDSSSCYTTDAEPTTTSTVYSAPNTVSALTVTTGGSSSIVLSDNLTYNRRSSGDTQTYQDVASLYPNHLAFVDNVGVKIGNTLIADKADMSSRADTDLSNLTAEGKNVANWFTNNGGCIIAAPNGVMSYSGNTITIKSGLKVSIPDGLDSDGYPKNKTVTLSEDKTLTADYTQDGRVCIFITPEGNVYNLNSTWKVTTTDIPSSNTYIKKFSASDNTWYSSSDGGTTWTAETFTIIGTYFHWSSAITALYGKPVFLSAGMNDGHYISSQFLPSTRYWTLGTPASEATFTALANGFIRFSHTTTGNSSYTGINNVTKNLTTGLWTTVNGSVVDCYLPVAAGDVCNVAYNNGSINILAFIYAEGDK